MPLTYHRFVGNLCQRTTSPLMTSVDELQARLYSSADELQARRWSSFDELQARRWLLLMNYKSVGDFCWRTTSPSVTSVDELQARRWLLLTNYKSVDDCCWRTTSPSVTSVELLVSGSLCWLDNMSELQAQPIGELLDLVTTASNMSKLQAQLMEVDYCCPQ